MNTILGVFLTAVAGIGTGCSLWPIKMIRRLQFEHWWFIGMIPLVLVPWIIMLTGIKNSWAIYAEIGWGPLVLSNLFAIGWGVANVLAGLCTLRIGFALSSAIITGTGVIGTVIVPMIFKGTGPFHNSPDILSITGLTVLVGVAMMLVGVILSAAAGFGRERIIKQKGETHRFASGGFRGGLIMAIIAGILSVGPSLAFVYTHDSIIQVMKFHGAGEIQANFAFWAVGLLGGALVNLVYPAWLMTKNRSWGMLIQHPRESLLAAIIGTQLVTAFGLQGMGMVALGALGASIGAGIQRAMQVMSAQGMGIVSGEWAGIDTKSHRQMIAAVVALIIAIIIMVWAH